MPSTSTVSRGMGRVGLVRALSGMNGGRLIDEPLHPQLAHERAPEDEHIAGCASKPGVEPCEKAFGVVDAAASTGRRREDLAHLRRARPHPGDLRVGEADL